MKKLPLLYAKQHHVLIKEALPDVVKVVYRHGLSRSTLSEILRATALPMALENVSSEEFDALLMQLYQKGTDEAMQSVEHIYESIDTNLESIVPRAVDLLESNDEAPIIRLINVIFSEAVKRRASDIHIETYEKTMAIRYRIDGVLQEVLQPQRAISLLVISRIKVMAKMDIAEKRLPQDGRISIMLGERQVDVRVSSLPSQYGERIVMRLLDKHAMKMTIDALGMLEEQLQLFKEALSKPHGIIIVTGPTGSGKTTTLYAGLSSLNAHQENILTIEDPIEYELEGIGQTQVNAKINMSFAAGLRAILRQDPDVVMLGEIRDNETADIAVQASQTGHLVLTTLHTNNALGALTRLQNLGIDSSLLCESVVALIGQRLVRRLCPACKKTRPMTPEEEPLFEQLSDFSRSKILYEADPKGCETCSFIGFFGRIGIYEIIPMNKILIELIQKKSSEYEMIQKMGHQIGSMRRSGLIACMKGTTTLQEVERITMEY